MLRSFSFFVSKMQITPGHIMGYYSSFSVNAKLYSHAGINNWPGGRN